VQWAKRQKHVSQPRPARDTLAISKRVRMKTYDTSFTVSRMKQCGKKLKKIKGVYKANEMN